MSEDSPIKDALYSKISAIGEESIHNLLLEKKYSELFEIMYENVLESIKEKFDENEIAGTLMESLIHYIFTEMLIPSQRKIIYENIEFDIIIPNLMELKKNPETSILIFFVKSSNHDRFKHKIEQAKKIQKSNENIWVISKDKIDISQRIYKIEKKAFSRFLQDTQNFTELKNLNKLNIFKTKF